jgi:hypothetical protein
MAEPNCPPSISLQKDFFFHISHMIEGVFLKYAEISPTRLWDNVED